MIVRKETKPGLRPLVVAGRYLGEFTDEQMAVVVGARIGLTGVRNDHLIIMAPGMLCLFNMV